MAARGRKSILVVDDDPEIRSLLETVLREEGYSVRSAANGLEAIHAVEDSVPDLVVMDLMMPLMDGAETARELWSRYGRRVPIVVLTASEVDSSLVRELPANRWMAKPFDLSILLGVVAEHAA